MTSATEHPSFGRPTIVEALCEIHFQLGENRPWQDSWFGVFFERVKSEHPVFEPRPVAQVEASVGREGLEHRYRLQNRVFVRSQDGTRLIQLAPALLTRNVLSPYPGWSAFRTGVESAFSALDEIAGVGSVRRIGLRFINRLPRSNGDERLGEWLRECPELPSSLLERSGGFALRFEWAAAESRRLVLNLGVGSEANDEVLLDFDAIAESLDARSWSQVATELEELHDRVWHLFTGMIGPRYRSYLERREP